MRSVARGTRKARRGIQWGWEEGEVPLQGVGLRGCHCCMVTLETDRVEAPVGAHWS
jgi:hypothetical protein